MLDTNAIEYNVDKEVDLLNDKLKMVNMFTGLCAILLLCGVLFGVDKILLEWLGLCAGVSTLVALIARPIIDSKVLQLLGKDYE